MIKTAGKTQYLLAGIFFILRFLCSIYLFVNLDVNGLIEAKDNEFLVIDKYGEQFYGVIKAWWTFYLNEIAGFIIINIIGAFTAIPFYNECNRL